MNTKRNKFTFGLGTVGRDMVYTMVSMYLMFYLTDVLTLSTDVLWWVTSIMMVVRIFDAVNDPFMGVIVDNSHSRFGRFKPWICIGGILSSIFTVLFFTDLGLEGAPYIIFFTIVYLFWEISYTMHDIAYWSMLPTLSQDLHEREKIGSVARICANVGLFLVVALIVPITTALGNIFGSLQKGYFVLAIILVSIMILFLCFTVFGVKETNLAVEQKDSTSFKELLSIIFKNDQLMVTAIANALFMIGYSTTTSFGLYYFKYVYGNEDMYSIFAVILGVSQIVALSVFPAFASKYPRKLLYTIATGLVLAGYVIFFFAPNTTMLYIGIAGILLFVGQAFIQVLMLLFLTDSVEYGEWKLGKRNDSVTFSLQPFINKMGGAVASGIVGAIVIVSGMQKAQSAADMTEEGLLIFKMAMMVFPLVCIVVGFLIYRAKYILDEKMFTKIVEELNERNSK
ncbi:MAG: MFS transporter [Lachnospiraceae bacterium]|nr:MFS transporter [Lachnospiraceae bacterium]